MATQAGSVHVGATQRPSLVHLHTQNCSGTNAAPCSYGPGETLGLSSWIDTMEVLMQHQFWARMKLVQRIRKCGGRKLPAWIPPQSPNAHLLIGPALSLHHHSFQASAVCCPIGTEVIWAQPSHTLRWTHTFSSCPWKLKLSVFLRIYNLFFFFSFKLVLTIWKSVRFMSGIMN